MERLSSRSKILIGLTLMLSIIIMGVGGFMVIEDDSFLNALYMTVITVSTVGFGEIHKLSDGGKVFTIFLIISSFTTYAYALTTISTHFFEGQLQFFLTGYKSKTIKKMQDHVIVCGYGRNGHQVVKELQAQGQSCIVVDSDPKSVSEEKGKLLFVVGDATQDEVLLKANIKFAKSLITTLPMDADNLYVVLTARSLNPGMNIISRGAIGSSEKKLRMAGVDSVVMPESVGGTHMADLVTRPDIIEFMEHVSVHSEDPTMLEEIVCPELPDKVKSKTIYEIGIRRKTGANIIGYKTTDGRFILNPTADTRVIPGSKLFVLGTPEQIADMKEILSEHD